MESAVAVSGHGSGLPLQVPGSASRKEWRVVNDSSGRERIVGDAPGNQARLNVAGRPRSSNSGASRRNSRNGQTFHPSGSDHSSDSDHHGRDIGGAHLMGASLAPQELMPQSISQGDDAVLYEEAMRREGWHSLSKDHVFQMHRAQQRNEHLDSALSSMSMASGLTAMESPDDALQQRLHEVSRQREQFQQAEVELRAQFIARTEVIRLQNGFDEQAKQQSEITSTLQGQIQEREQRIRHLEQQIEERERQLHVNQIETNEAVWAKDALLREQTNELSTLRRDRDSAVAEHQAAAAQFDGERTEHRAQLENLKDQLQEKDRQCLEAEEQNRNSQDIIVYKDEQLRDLQAWVARAQELDAYHVNTTNTLHGELRERTEQMNQLWAGYQRQLAEVERYYNQTQQRLQLELADAREQIRALSGGATAEHLDVKGEEHPIGTDSRDGMRETNDGPGKNGNRILMAVSPASSNRAPMSAVVANGDIPSSGVREHLLPVLLPRDGLQPKIEHASALPVVQAPLMGMPTVLPPPGPAPGIHPFGMHQQGMPSPLQVPQPPLAQLPIATVFGPQHLPPPLQHQQVRHHHHHHPQQQQTSQMHRGSQRPQTQPVQHTSQPQPPQLQHSQQPSSLQSPGQQGGHQDVQVQQQQHQHQLREQVSHDQASKQADQQRNGLVGESSPLTTQHHIAHSQALQQQQQQQQQQLSSHLLHQQQSQGLALGATVPEHKDMSSAAQPSHQEEQPLPSDVQHQPRQASEVQQERELAVHHRQQTKAHERQSYEQRRSLDPRLHQFAHQQAKQPRPQGQAEQTSQHENDEPHSQQLQHPPKMISGMGHSGPHSSSLSQENGSQGQAPRDVAVNVATAEKQEFQKSAAHFSKQQENYGDANSKGGEPVLLDERSLLACLVRAVPADASARIKISTTLPNRLGKMLAPLHWHDYRKQYGRLDEFVGSHPELFLIEGDFVHVREGAHATFSATTAQAKAAAAAAAVAPPPAPARVPTVAITPVAQPPLQRGRSLKNSNIAHKESKAGSTTLDVGSQPPLPSQTGNLRQQIQGSAVARNAVENRLTNLHHSTVSLGRASKHEGKTEGQRHVEGAPKANGLTSSHGNENFVGLESGGMNGFGNSGKGGGYYGSRQQGRGSVAGAGQYRKQGGHVRLQTQEGQMAELVMTASQ